MSGAEEGPVASGKYTLLFNDVKDGLEKNIPNLDPALAESMAHTLIILVRRCEQKLDTSQHVQDVQDVDPEKIKQLDNQLINFRVHGEYWAIDCKSETIEDYSWTQFESMFNLTVQFKFPKGFDCFARQNITMSFENGLFIVFENTDHGADDNMMLGNFTDRCVTKKP